MADFSPKQRHNLANKDMAMPDGSYPIRNKADLKRAVQAYGRAKNPEATKLWICKRAKELNAMDLVPEAWWKEKGITHMADDSELVTTDPIEDFLAHYGVLGMKWGVRKEDKQHSPEYLARKERLASQYDKQAARARRDIEKLDARKPFNRVERRAISVARAASVAREAKAKTAAKLIRKPGSRITVTAERITRNPSDDHLTARERLKKKPFELSNKEIRETNERLQMEKKLKELRRETRKIEQGRQKVELTLKIVGTAAAVYAATQTPFGKIAIKKGADFIKALKVARTF